MSDRFVIVLSGDTASARAAALDHAARRMKAEGLRALDVSETSDKVKLRVTISSPASETSFDHGVAYARGEIADGIGEAGGSIWDRTHVQIQIVR